jgi:hypothetical protein
MSSPLARLDLDPEQVDGTARFLRSYARTALDDLEDTLVRASRGAAASERVLLEDPAFTLAADAASALREAAQWTVFLDPPQARSLFVQSGQLFHALGYAFGIYLQALGGAWNGYPLEQGHPGQRFGPATVRTFGEGWAEDAPYRVFGSAIRMLENQSAIIDDGSPVGPDLRFQQQQVYLLLASGGVEAISREFSRALTEIIETSPQRFGVAPVGSLGTPVRRLWAIAEQLIRADEEAPVQIGRHLVAMGQRYDEAIGSARVNTYLWRNGAAPVDLCDIDISGCVALAARRLGPDGLRVELDRSGGPTRLDSAWAPLEAGFVLAGY